MKVLFCGFMGAGKSHVLNILGGQAIGFEKVDLDDWILAAHNQKNHQQFKTLADLIENKGWEYFRNLESKELMALVKEPRKLLIALGGGTLNHALLQDLKKYNFYLVWLATPFELCLERIRGDHHRPLSKKTDEELRLLYEERTKLYRQAHEIIQPQNFDWVSWWKIFSSRTNL